MKWDNFPKLWEVPSGIWKKNNCEKFFLRTILFQEELYPPAVYTFLWVKLVNFTLENHIHVKALKMQGFPNN